MMALGIDASRYQGAIDWRAAKAAGVAYAWLKASEGTTWIDPTFATNARGAADAGVLWGGYHYFRNGIDPAAQAAHFARVMLSAGVAPTLLPACDLEDQIGDVREADVRAFVEAVAADAGGAVIYTGAPWWRRNIGAGATWAADYPLWIARYGVNDPAAAPVEPAVPAPWDGWTVHQYTSRGRGATYGIEAQYVDLNRVRPEDMDRITRWPTDAGLQWPKVVWAIQEARRILERDGLAAESAWLGTNVEAGIIERRDG